MKIYTCTDHKGHYVGVASVVVAENHTEACVLLGDELRRVGLGGGGFTLDEIDPTVRQAVILCDGDY